MKWMLRLVVLYMVTLAVIAVVSLTFAATSGAPAGGRSDQPTHYQNAVSHNAYEIHKMIAHTP